MRWFNVFTLRLKSLFRRDRVEDDLADEIDDHLKQRAQEFIARGLTPEDAHFAALRAFGGVDQRKEECRDSRRVGFLDDLVRDVAYAGRMMRRSAGFTSIAVLSLGVAIGATTAVFSIVDFLLLRRLPVANPERLALVDTDDIITLQQFENLRERNVVFDTVSASWMIERTNLTIHPVGSGLTSVQPDAGLLRIGLVSATYFDTMGVTAAVGRTFAADEDRILGGHPIAVISDVYWQRRFARTPDVVGRRFGLNGVTYTIIGVTPRGFTGEWVGVPTDVWVPFAMASQVAPEFPGGPERFPRRVLGRLRPAVSIDQAQASAKLLYHQFLHEEAGSKVTKERLEEIARTPLMVVSAARGYSPQRQTFAQPIAILTGAAGALLLIACANLANLLLARSAARQREVAVRLAIGASRSRVARQMITESLVLAGLGAIVGTMLAVWANDILAGMIAMAPVNASGQSGGFDFDLSLNSRSVLFAAAVSLITAVMFGIAPARSATAIQPSTTLSQNNTRVIGLGRAFGPRTALVMAQVALALLLLVGAGLLSRTIRNLKSEELGFPRERLLLVWTMPGQTGRQDTAMARLWHTVQERLSAVPGVVSVGASNQPVLRGVDMPAGTGLRTFVTPGFFRTMGVPLRAGRDFTEQDTESSAPVVIINESMARSNYSDGPVVGRKVRLAGAKSPLTEIVGVVGDFTNGTPRGGLHTEFATYFPYQDREALNRGAQSRLRSMVIALRTTGEPLAIADRLRRELLAIDPLFPVLRINTIEGQLDAVLAHDWLLATLSAFLGGTSVLVACLGLFALLSYQVAQRTNEIGVRLALGATRLSVMAMVLRETTWLVAAGIVIGLPMAILATRLIANRLFGLTPTDPPTLIGASLLIVIVAFAAAAFPARRAASIEPMRALRCD